MWRINKRERPGFPLIFLSLLAMPIFAAQSPQTLTCATCHHEKAKTQPLTSMGQALHTAATDPLFQTHPNMTVRKGKFLYSIETHGGRTTYSVSDGSKTLSFPVHWAFGRGSQTYVFDRNGKFYESLVSYYPEINGLDTTMGDESLHPQTLEQAFGRPLEASEYVPCFGCHSTGAVTDHELHFNTLHPGVHCERCHTDAAKHLQGFLDGKPVRPRKLEDLSPEQISTFCGQCHRSWQTVMRKRLRGPVDVRFPPYRLELSKCFDGTDRRMSCIACHDPHQEVNHDIKSYDAKCLACHSPGAKLSLGMIRAHPQATSMPVCPVSKTNCVSCHMPKVALPGGHRTYRDHFIRIVHAGEKYPD